MNDARYQPIAICASLFLQEILIDLGSLVPSSRIDEALSSPVSRKTSDVFRFIDADDGENDVGEAGDSGAKREE
ncbi:hypothetical protein L484_022416 [Morus notabilis]|uniref:Uncharacterized protein n=1 Tax=Morus notabilis TaxID=981085 RepID=W9QT18_9ROSA|nr:hypothetical protein L484_022416 [Morus notabilis]